MIPLLLAAVTGYGVYLVFTAWAYGWSGPGIGPRWSPTGKGGAVDMEQWMRQAGIDRVDRREFIGVVTMLFVLGALVAFALFGGVVPALVAGLFAASFPVASYRRRRSTRRARTQEAWPRLIEEMRILIGSVGRSIPQALFEAGRDGPEEMQSAFDAAHREWLLSTDFARTISTLKARLADSTADTICETLLIAHELGGADLDSRLGALADDRIRDLQARKDARSRQAGARFARWFVLAVPLGMAIAGMSIGQGRRSYQSADGQLFVVIAIGLVVGCWVWASRIMALPSEERVFG